MKLILLALSLGLFGCATQYPEFGTTMYSGQIGAYYQKMEQEHGAQWAEWDKKYIDDDTLIIEINEVSPGKYRGVAR